MDAFPASILLSPSVYRPKQSRRHDAQQDKQRRRFGYCQDHSGNLSGMAEADKPGRSDDKSHVVTAKGVYFARA